MLKKIGKKRRNKFTKSQITSSNHSFQNQNYKYQWTNVQKEKTYAALEKRKRENIKNFNVTKLKVTPRSRNI